MALFNGHPSTRSCFLASPVAVGMLFFIACYMLFFLFLLICCLSCIQRSLRIGREYHNIRYSTEAAAGHDLPSVVSMLTPSTSSISLPTRVVSSPVIRRGAPLPPPTPTPSAR